MFTTCVVVVNERMQSTDVNVYQHLANSSFVTGAPAVRLCALTSDVASSAHI